MCSLRSESEIVVSSFVLVKMGQTIVHPCHKHRRSMNATELKRSMENTPSTRRIPKGPYVFERHAFLYRIVIYFLDVEEASERVYTAYSG